MDNDLGFTKRQLNYKQRILNRYRTMTPTAQKAAIGFGYGFMFGSTIGLIGGLQHLGNEELRVGRRVVKMAKQGVGVGVMCGVFVTIGFTVLR